MAPQLSQPASTADQSEDSHFEMFSRNHMSTPPLGLSARSSTQSLNSTDTGGRPRIDREEVKRRLLKKQSPETSDLPNVILNDNEAPNEWDKSEEEREEKDRMSVITTMTDFSAEMATIERAEKLKMTSAGVGEERELGLLGSSQRLQFDFGSKFGLGGLGIGSMDRDPGGSVGSRDSMGMLNLGVSSETSGSVKSGGSMKMGMGEVDVDMDMRSALDRLMDDVAGTRADDSMMTDEGDSFLHEEVQASTSTRPKGKPMERAATDTALLHNNFASRNPSGVSMATPPPPVPPKDNIRSREQLILEKRREAKRMEEDESLGYYTPPKAFGGRSSGQALLGVGRPSRRRSMSTGDVDAGAKRRGDVLLDVVGVGNGAPGDDALADSIEKELKRLVSGSPKSVSRFLVVDFITILILIAVVEIPCPRTGRDDIRIFFRPRSYLPCFWTWGPEHGEGLEDGSTAFRHGTFVPCLVRIGLTLFLERVLKTNKRVSSAREAWKGVW